MNMTDDELASLNRWADRLQRQSSVCSSFSPIAWLIGVEWGDCCGFGQLLGNEMATNEVIGYEGLAEAIKTGGMSQRSIVMATYSLCGFANFSSIGIQIGGIGSLAPTRRPRPPRPPRHARRGDGLLDDQLHRGGAGGRLTLRINPESLGESGDDVCQAHEDQGGNEAAHEQLQPVDQQIASCMK